MSRYTRRNTALQPNTLRLYDKLDALDLALRARGIMCVKVNTGGYAVSQGRDLAISKILTEAPDLLLNRDAYNVPLVWYSVLHRIDESDGFSYLYSDEDDNLFCDGLGDRLETEDHAKPTILAAIPKSEHTITFSKEEHIIAWEPSPGTHSVRLFYMEDKTLSKKELSQNIIEVAITVGLLVEWDGDIEVYITVLLIDEPTLGE